MPFGHQREKGPVGPETVCSQLSVPMEKPQATVRNLFCVFSIEPHVTLVHLAKATVDCSADIQSKDYKVIVLKFLLRGPVFKETAQGRRETSLGPLSVGVRAFVRPPQNRLRYGMEVCISLFSSHHVIQSPDSCSIRPSMLPLHMYSLAIARQPAASDLATPKWKE